VEILGRCLGDVQKIVNDDELFEGALEFAGNAVNLAA
jgi:hypothetical protein